MRTINCPESLASAQQCGHIATRLGLTYERHIIGKREIPCHPSRPVHRVVDYTEHAIGKGSEAKAVAYVETINGDGDVLWGVGTDENTVTASLRAVLSAHERHTLTTAH
jgi:hypothetical protein